MRKYSYERIKKSMLAGVLSIALVCTSIVPFTMVANAEEEASNAERLYGATRYETSIMAAESLKGALGVEKFDAIVVANGENYPDALAGGYLASVKRAPLLIVTSTTEAKILDYIKSNAKAGAKVYLLGGTGVVSTKFESSVAGAGFGTVRLGGVTRYDTNIAILRETRDPRLVNRGDLAIELDVVTNSLAALETDLAEIEKDLALAAENEDKAAELKEKTAKALSDADAKLEAAGINPHDYKDKLIAAENKVREEETAYEKIKAEASAEVTRTNNIRNNVGWNFLNSKAKTSIEYWRDKALAYSGTKAATNTSTFRNSVADATKYENLIIASQMIDKSNSLGGTSRKIDYNLMTAAVVASGVYGANRSLGLNHTFSWKVIDKWYGPWADENFAYGSDTSKVWDVWYHNERANNGPHFRNINDKSRNTTGYAYSTKGVSPSRTHVQEFGVNTTGAVTTTTAQFRTDLANYQKQAEVNYNKAVSDYNALKIEPASLQKARADLELAKHECENVGTAYGFDYWQLIEDYEQAEADCAEACDIYAKFVKAKEDTTKARDEEKAEYTEVKAKYDEAARVCEQANLHDEDVLICSGTGFADSLSASAANKPILLVGNTITDEQLSYLKSYDCSKYYMIGGTGAVSKAVEDKLAKELGKTKLDRIYGQTRYSTSVEVAKTFAGSSDKAVIAYGQNFPDGLSGGPLAIALHAPLILVDNINTKDAAAYVENAKIGGAIFLGGPALISDEAALSIGFRM